MPFFDRWHFWQIKKRPRRILKTIILDFKMAAVTVSNAVDDEDAARMERVNIESAGLSSDEFPPGMAKTIEILSQINEPCLFFLRHSQRPFCKGLSDDVPLTNVGKKSYISGDLAFRGLLKNAKCNVTLHLYF